jgi:hypothetical protein
VSPQGGGLRRTVSHPSKGSFFVENNLKEILAFCQNLTIRRKEELNMKKKLFAILSVATFALSMGSASATADEDRRAGCVYVGKGYWDCSNAEF